MNRFLNTFEKWITCGSLKIKFEVVEKEMVIDEEAD